MAEQGQNKLASASAGDNAYSFLRKKIIELHIRPGEKIHFSELTKLLNVSRSPIRDALMRLEKEGLVTTIAKKGTSVSKINIGRVMDERFLRACIEEKIAEEFIECCQEKHVQQLEAVITSQRIAAENGDVRVFIQLDDVFHSVFFEATGREFCLDVVHNMSGHYYRFRLLSISDSTILKETLDEHREILEAIVKRDSQELKRLISWHIGGKEIITDGLLSRHSDLFSGVVERVHEDENIWEGDFLGLN